MKHQLFAKSTRLFAAEDYYFIIMIAHGFAAVFANKSLRLLIVKKLQPGECLKNKFQNALKNA
jgi:hypothetical protein